MNYRLFKIIACPCCNGKLFYNKQKQELICKTDSLSYPLQNGIPILLKNKARIISLDELNA